jgi:hypothetical protein
MLERSASSRYNTNDQQVIICSALFSSKDFVMLELDLDKEREQDA